MSVGKPVTVSMRLSPLSLGMAPQAAYLVAGLRLDLGDERGGFLGVDGAGEHEILPDEEAHRVAQVVEDVLFIDAAAPDAQHVHVGVAGRGDEDLVAFIGDGADEGVGGDPVGAAGEDRYAVQCEPEKARPRLVGIRRLVQLQRADTHLRFVPAEHVAFLA